MITFFGLARADGCYACSAANCICKGTPTPVPKYEGGIRVFEVTANSGFIVVLEAKPGSNGRSVGNSVPPPISGQPDRPDLQILASRPWGNGSAAVCDTDPASGGGVPGFNPPTIGGDQAITDALVDLACRYGSFLPGSPCTLDGNGNDSVLTPGGLTNGRQFCNVVSPRIGVPVGDTLLTAQVRDTQGTVGPLQQVIIRHTGTDPTETSTPSPSPTPTPTLTLSPTPTVVVCCQCGAFACGPVLQSGSCGSCEAVAGAVCDLGSGRCSTPTPTSTPTRSATATSTGTPASTATSTPTATPTNTSTPTATPTPTLPLGPNDCCQCDLPACGAAIAGVCGLCDVVHDAACSPSGVCLTHTPNPTPTSTPTPTTTPTGIGIAGSIRYYATGFPLAGVTVSLIGPQALSTMTTAEGQYRFEGIPAGRWEIVASYSPDAEAGVSAYDAAFVLQAAAQLRSFSPAQTLACDVDGDGTVTPDDTSALLQYAVGMTDGLPVGDRCATTMLFRPVPAAHAGQQVVPPQVDALVCEPGRIILDGLAAWAGAQDFDAVLLGDCTGNWVQP